LDWNFAGDDFLKRLKTVKESGQGNWFWRNKEYIISAAFFAFAVYTCSCATDFFSQTYEHITIT